MAQQNYEAINRYNRDNYDRITIIVPKGAKQRLQADAENAGLTLNKYLLSFLPYAFEFKSEE